MVFLPLVTFLVVSCTNLDPLLKVGFIIVSLCPGGTTSNFISYLVNADVALSISLTTINSFLILLTIPIGTNLALDYFMHQHTTSISLDFYETIKQVLTIILIPAVLGLLFNHFAPNSSRIIRNPFKYINVCLLGLVYALKIFAGEESGGSGISFNDIKILLPIALFLQVCTMVGSYFIATKFLQRKTSCLTIGIEVGLQNTTLALVVATVMLGSNPMGKPALVYALFSFFTTIVYSWVVYQFVILRDRKKYFIQTGKSG